MGRTGEPGTRAGFGLNLGDPRHHILPRLPPAPGAAGRVERVPGGQGRGDPVPADAQRQLHQGHGRRGQRRLGHQLQSAAQGGHAARQLPPLLQRRPGQDQVRAAASRPRPSSVGSSGAMGQGSLGGQVARRCPHSQHRPCSQHCPCSQLHSPAQQHPALSLLVVRALGGTWLCWAFGGDLLLQPHVDCGEKRRVQRGMSETCSSPSR